MHIHLKQNAARDRRTELNALKIWFELDRGQDKHWNFKMDMKC